MPQIRICGIAHMKAELIAFEEIVGLEGLRS